MRKFYITSPIYYVNAPPHLGHVYTNVVADVLARYHRLKGYDVFFLTGTYEHGAKVARSAHKAGKEPKAFVDELAAQFQEAARTFHISYTDFIRTSDQGKHWPGAQKLWKQLDDAQDLYKASYKGLYCVGHEAFVTDKDLKNGRCLEHDIEPEVIEEENYFFRLSKYVSKIKEAILADTLNIKPPARRNEVLALLEGGVEDVSFSRPSKDIPWGIPVPGDDTQTMYVWCDALSNYISALGYGRTNDENFRKYWPCDVHVIGKDILRFHAVIWPGMLLSAGLPFPKSIFIHGHILSGGKKMSKTLGNVIDPFQLQQEYGTDAVRNFVISEIPSFEDGDITIERFREIYTARFSNGIGNLVSRIATMIERFFNGEIKKPDQALLDNLPLKITDAACHVLGEEKTEESFYSSVQAIIHTEERKYHQALEDFNLNRAAQSAWLLLRHCDWYIQEYQPFKLVKEDKNKGEAVLWNAATLLLAGAWFLRPMIPETAEKIFEIFNVGSGGELLSWNEITGKSIQPLFPRLDLDT